MKEIWMFYLLFINVLSFSLMGVDKFQAIRNRWRIKENTLHFFSLTGGVLGTIAAMGIFRHKIRKKRFVLVTSLIVIFQLIVIYYRIQGVML